MKDKVNFLLEAVAEAGERILALQATNFTISRKANNDLVTEGDMLANDILRQRLGDAFGEEIGWLSEENVDNPARLACKKLWIVDPIDGTKEYAHGIPEYAISVALIEHGKPTLAAVFNPASNELFHAIKGEGVWLNNVKVQCSQKKSQPMVILASRSEYAKGVWDRFKPHCSVKQIGSIAYKLALVAAGYADATFSLGPKSEWDIAAGVLLVEEAGGLVATKHQESITFNRDNVRVNSIVATSSMANEEVFSLINQS